MVDSISIRVMKEGEEHEVCALVTRLFDKFVAPDFPPAGVEEFARYAKAEALAERS